MKFIISFLIASLAITDASRYSLLRVGSSTKRKSNTSVNTRLEPAQHARSLFDEDFHAAFRQLFGYGDLSISMASAGLSLSMGQLQLSFSMPSETSSPTTITTTSAPTSSPEEDDGEDNTTDAPTSTPAMPSDFPSDSPSAGPTRFTTNAPTTSPTPAFPVDDDPNLGVQASERDAPVETNLLNDNGSSGTSTIYIAVGAICGVAALAAIAFVVVRKMKQDSGASQASDVSSLQSSSNNGEMVSSTMAEL